jgi:CubicO group peptidase (beta-lactamase class C family)
MMQIVKPETVGLSSARLARIGAVLQSRIERGDLAGAIAVAARKGAVAYCQCRGLADVEGGKPMAEDAILRFYSMTKPVTSAALLMLYEEGCFQLDDPVAAFIPEFRELKVLRQMTDSGPELAELQRPVTFRHLFTHTSGLGYPNPQGTPAERLLSEAMGGPREAHTLEEWIPRLVQAPLAHQPGADWTYGFSIDVLGRLIEVISGQPLDLFLRERMFAPLGMVDTDFYVPEAKHPRLARVYRRREGGGFEVAEQANNAFWAKPRFLAGGGGLVSTAADYLRFAQMLVNGGELAGNRLLGRRTVRLMASGHIPQLMGQPRFAEGQAFGRGYTYGLGGRVYLDEAVGLQGSVGTYGWDGMACTTFWVDPREELVGMLLPQMVTWPAALHEQFRVLVYQALI